METATNRKADYLASAKALFDSGYISAATYRKAVSQIESGITRPGFIKPTVQEMGDYFVDFHGHDTQSVCDEANNCWDFYESKGWVIGNNKMKDWKSTARRWIRSNLKNGNSTKSSPHNSGKPNKTQGQQVGIPSGASSGNVDMAAVLRRGPR